MLIACHTSRPLLCKDGCIMHDASDSSSIQAESSMALPTQNSGLHAEYTLRSRGCSLLTVRTWQVHHASTCTAAPNVCVVAHPYIPCCTLLKLQSSLHASAPATRHANTNTQENTSVDMSSASLESGGLTCRVYL